MEDSPGQGFFSSLPSFPSFPYSFLLFSLTGGCPKYNGRTDFRCVRFLLKNEKRKQLLLRQEGPLCPGGIDDLRNLPMVVLQDLCLAVMGLLVKDSRRNRIQLRIQCQKLLGRFRFQVDLSGYSGPGGNRQSQLEGITLPPEIQRHLQLA